MLAAGIKVGPQESADGEPKKKATYDNKKKKSQLQQKVRDSESELWVPRLEHVLMPAD